MGQRLPQSAFHGTILSAKKKQKVKPPCQGTRQVKNKGVEPRGACGNSGHRLFSRAKLDGETVTQPQTMEAAMFPGQICGIESQNQIPSATAIKARRIASEDRNDGSGDREKERPARAMSARNCVLAEAPSHWFCPSAHFSRRPRHAERMKNQGISRRHCGGIHHQA